MHHYRWLLAGPYFRTLFNYLQNVGVGWLRIGIFTKLNFLATPPRHDMVDFNCMKIKPFLFDLKMQSNRRAHPVLHTVGEEGWKINLLTISICDFSPLPQLPGYATVERQTNAFATCAEKPAMPLSVVRWTSPSSDLNNKNLKIILWSPIRTHLTFRMFKGQLNNYLLQVWPGCLSGRWCFKFLLHKLKEIQTFVSGSCNANAEKCEYK